MNNIDLKNKYFDEIEKINNFYFNILQTRLIYEKLKEILLQNKKIDDSNVFFWWLKQNYVYSLIIQIVKLIDYDKDSVSLLNLMNKLLKSRYISEDQYLKTFKVHPTQETDDSIKKEFNNLINKNNACCPVEMIIIDKEIIEEKCKKIRKYRNKIIAHNCKRQKDLKLTIGDIDDTIEFLKELINKYKLLITGNKYAHIEPDFYNFDSIFKIPWIK